MEASASTFVNREKELQQINEAVEALKDEQRLLRTPIIEFSGVQGIGKTTLLQQIKIICDNKSIQCVMEKAEQITPDNFNQVESLVRKGTVAVILDALDAADSQKLQIIETRLSELIEDKNSRLFVVLASRNVQKFENTRSLARKLKIFSLEPLKRESCLSYLNNLAPAIPSAAYDIVLDWTQGYPLAMRVITEAIVQEALDPTKEQDQRQLLKILMKDVIKKNLLGNTAPSEQERLQTLLTILSFPRRFNLILAQDLIEKFAYQYRLESSLAYITLPKAINEETNVLNWRLERAGYCIETPIRNLFLLQYRIEQPQQYATIHKFLVEKNERFAQEVTGPDRIRYQREIFYHLASSGEEVQLHKSLSQHIGQLAQIEKQDEQSLLQPLQGFLQFYEEFQLDEELKETLGEENLRFALSLVYKDFMEIYRQLPEKMQGDWLDEFFSLVIQQPKSDDFLLTFKRGMHQIIRQISRDDAIEIYNELIQNKKLKGLLEFDESREQFLAELLNEG